MVSILAVMALNNLIISLVRLWCTQPQTCIALCAIFFFSCVIFLLTILPNYYSSYLHRISPSMFLPSKLSSQESFTLMYMYQTYSNTTLVSSHTTLQLNLDHTTIIWKQTPTIESEDAMWIGHCKGKQNHNQCIKIELQTFVQDLRVLCCFKTWDNTLHKIWKYAN